MAETTAAPAERRIDLDWIRIAAFGLLILYHVGMLYVTWGFHVKSPSIVPALEPLMLALNPWRLGLLFLVSGSATAFMLGRLAPGRLARQRSWRLLLPLIFGMLVIVPPQSYLQVVDSFGYRGSFWDFYVADYLGLPHLFCAATDQRRHCIILPTWNHLWFVLYLWAYTMLLAAFLALAPGLVARLQPALERAMAGVGILVWPVLLLALCRTMLFPRFPETHALFDDWYAHAVYFALFLIGFLIARSARLWQAIEDWRWAALAGAVLGYGLYLGAYLARQGGFAADWLPAGQRAAFGLEQWCAIVAVLGFGRRWLPRRDSAARRYLTDAVFPYYIIHQTAIIVVAWFIAPWRLAAATEAAIVISATVVACALTYELARRSAWLRPLFGLRTEGPPKANLAPAA